MKVRYYLILLFVLLIPIVLIFLLTRQELQANRPAERANLIQTAYGNAIPVQYGEIRESMPVEGTVLADSYFELSVPESLVEEVSYLSAGDEFKSGDLIASSVSEELRLSEDAVFESFIRGNDGSLNLQFRSFNQLSIELFFERDLRLDSDGSFLLAVGNESYELRNPVKSRQYFDEGVRLLFDLQTEANNLLHGQPLSAVFYTGVVETGILNVPLSSLYFSRSLNQYAVRLVSETNTFIEEVAVQTGVQDLENIAVVGLDEGMYVDDGASRVYGHTALNEAGE